MPPLNRRQTIGSPLSIPQMDGNLDIIAAFVNTIAALIATSLNPDGTLVNGAVSLASLQNRIIGANNLLPNALPFFVDSGTTNAYVITATPAFTAYQDGMILFVAASSTNTGPCTLQAVNGQPAVSILDKTGSQLQAGAIQSEQVFCVCYYGGNFRLVTGSVTNNNNGGGGSGGTNFTGVTQFTPADQALPGNGSSITLAHGLNGQPQEVIVSLVCTTADAGCNPGDVVPIDLFEDATAHSEAFSVRANGTNIIVTQNTASLALAGTAITSTGNWLVRVYAQILTSTTSQMFPAISVTAARPDGAQSYGNYLFYFTRANSGNRATYPQQLNMQTGKIIILNNAATAQNFSQVNAAMFRNAAGQDILVWTCSTGTYWMNLSNPTPNPWQPTRLCDVTGVSGTGGILHRHKPVVYDQVNNLVYAVQSHRAAGNINAIKLVVITIGSNTATYTGTALNLTAGNANWASVLGTNKAEYAAWYPNGSTANVIFVQYNPVLKRIYVMTDDNAGIHIFDITACPGLTGKSVDFWTWFNQSDATRMGQLTYQKTIVIGGGMGLSVNDQDYDIPAIEFDLTTGYEKTISFCRNSDQPSGEVVRVPWLELA